MTPPARRSSARTSAGRRRASSTSEKRPAVPEPCSVTTNGRPEKRATAAVSSQCACTRSAPRAARRTACSIESSISGAAHGRRRRFAAIPPPYASPKSR